MAIVAYRWCHRRGNLSGPAPSLATQRAMLAELDGVLRATAQAPIAVRLESWERPPDIDPDGDWLARITLDAEPSALGQPLAQWLAWRHPRWIWSAEPFPYQRGEAKHG